MSFIKIKTFASAGGIRWYVYKTAAPESWQVVGLSDGGGRGDQLCLAGRYRKTERCPVDFVRSSPNFNYAKAS